MEATEEQPGSGEVVNEPPLPTLTVAAVARRLGVAPPSLVEGPIVEGQVLLSIPVRHTISGMSSAGREVDVVDRGGRPRGRPDRPSDVLPNPAPFYVAALTAMIERLSSIINFVKSFIGL